MNQIRPPKSFSYIVSEITNHYLYGDKNFGIIKTP